jgi:hypothetical protein
MRAMGVVLLLGAVACGGGGSSKPSRDECAIAVSHRWLIEDLTEIDPDLARVQGEALVNDPGTAKAAYDTIMIAENGGRPRGAGIAAIEECTRGTRAQVACVLASATAGAIAKCAK